MKKLIFVYNADSGISNAIKDSIHKIFSPKTYDCNLCNLTYSPISMKSDWKKFIKSLNLETEFLHKDEFEQKYNRKGKFPAVFLLENDFKLLINNDEMNACKDLNALKELIKIKLKW